MARGLTVDIDIVDESGKRLVKLTLKDPKAITISSGEIKRGPPNHHELWFSPDEDFALTRYRIRAYGSYAYEKLRVDYEIVCSDFRREGKISIPTSFIGIRKSHADGRIRRQQAIIKHFSTEPPADADMRLEIPVNTLVVDSVKMEAYKILPNGERLYSPVLDVNTGRVIHPPPDKTTAAAATQPATESD